jgi:hypothetical protein
VFLCRCPILWVLLMTSRLRYTDHVSLESGFRYLLCRFQSIPPYGNIIDMIVSKRASRGEIFDNKECVLNIDKRSMVLEIGN